MSKHSTISADLPFVISVKRYVDGRGWFSETFREERLADIGVACRFVQDNQSSSKRAGTLRGLHFQTPPAEQAKLVSVSRGKILDVAVDVRKGSPTYGKFVSAELSAESGHQMFVPAGFAHGFVTLEDDVIATYKVSSYYSPQHDGGIRWKDPDIAFPWPLPEANITTSDKDGRLPLLREFNSPFTYNGHPLGELQRVDFG
jgi:dTDP-4-dehydrorhamnose 3,5-epimerase